MKLIISSPKRLLSTAVTNHISVRFKTALDRFAQYITSVRIRLEDLNGPRGGEDKRCKVVVSFSSGGDLALDATSSDAYAAIDWAAQRVKMGVARRIDKQKDHRLARAAKKIA